MLALLWSRRGSGGCSSMVSMVLCQLHLLFGAQMLLCKCSCRQDPVASSPFPVESRDEIMSLGWLLSREGGLECWVPVTTLMCCIILCTLL